jgi:hypothetical protein
MDLFNLSVAISGNGHCMESRWNRCNYTKHGHVEEDQEKAWGKAREELIGVLHFGVISPSLVSSLGDYRHFTVHKAMYVHHYF